MYGATEKSHSTSMIDLEAEQRPGARKMLVFSGRYVRQFFFSVLAFLGVVTFLSRSRLSSRMVYGSDMNSIFNRTLGFERVFAINFAERSDKRDSLVVASSLAEFDFDWSAGVAFESISPKAAPASWNYEKRSNGSLGCWRAHMDVLQRIVHEKIQTALILEDDSDFDFSIKQQLFEFAEGARALQNLEDMSSVLQPTPSPYGDNWDMLWLGHCKLSPKSDATQFYVQENDPTVPPVANRNGLWMTDRIPDEVRQNNTRLVFKANNGGLCMYAYAVTYEGARKALSAMSIVPQDDVVDMSYRRICQGRLGLEFNCYGGYPTLFGSHRAAGPKSRDSDLNSKSHAWHKEYTFDMVYSTMQNIPALMAGSTTLKAQFPDIPDWPVDQRLTNSGALKRIDLSALPFEEIPGVNRPQSGERLI